MERVAVEKKVLNENDRIAAELRARFAEEGTLVYNFISSPGSGKTLFLERTLEALSKDLSVAVLTGDVQTDNDARRLARLGFPVQQITTAGACHLDARMIERALSAWAGRQFDLLLIENVGNLVCPTSYDLGEERKIVLLSVTEGEDKPLKYPLAFNTSHVALITKTDIAEAVGFDRAASHDAIRRVNPGIEILEIACRTGAGLDAWFALLETRLAAKSALPLPAVLSP